MVNRVQSPIRNSGHIFVAGGTGFLGYRVVRALLDAGADVTVMTRPDTEDRLGVLRSQVRLVTGDVWNPASLRGRARGHAAVIHLIGGVKPDPQRGLTFRHLNFVSARNITQMAINDGVPHFVFLSAAANPIGLSREYIESKREAERYLSKSGLAWTIIRTPPLFIPGTGRNPFYRLLSLWGFVPLLGRMFQGYAPLSADTAARAIASLALTGDAVHNRTLSARQFRREGRGAERRLIPAARVIEVDTGDGSEAEPPFGWLPSPER